MANFKIRHILFFPIMLFLPYNYKIEKGDKSHGRWISLTELKLDNVCQTHSLPFMVLGILSEKRLILFSNVIQTI